jgi:hypothetical protein
MNKYRVVFSLASAANDIECVVEAESYTGALDKACVWFYIQYPQWVPRIGNVTVYKL